MLGLNLRPTSLTRLHPQLHWVLRITVAACFIGHGAWGIITKEGWLQLMGSQNISPELAWKLMPVIGVLDVTMALSVLFQPRRLVLMWMFLWTLWTAILRPISGTPGMWEFWERAGNFIPVLMLLILGGTFAMNSKDWLSGYTEPALTRDKLGVLHFLGRLGIALLLIGHGGFGAIVDKQMLIDHFAAIGLPADLALINAVGWFEIGLGLLVFVFPLPKLLWFVLIWKIATEMLYVVEGGLLNSFEFIERAGDYGLPLVMIMIISTQRSLKAESSATP